MAEPSIAVGDVVDRYRIGGVLGEGAMGTVYLAEHTMIGRRFALKLLRKELASDGEVVQRFMNEARAAGTLGHTNICGSTDMGFFEGVPYIVLEYLEGMVLADEIHRRGALSARRSLVIARQIASALQAAHAANVIHRDLKSDNVFLTDSDERPDHVKVLDFGISKFLDAAAASRTQRGTLIGTPEFMAPEQIERADAVDGRADIYALGVILYHMIAGAKPFPLDDMRTLLHRIVHEPAPPLPDTVPQPLAALIERLMAKDPAARPATMTEVVDELTAIAESETFAKRPVTEPVRKISNSELSTPIAAAPAAITAPGSQRSRARFAVFGGIGLAAAAAGIFILARPGKDEAPDPATAVSHPQPPIATTQPPPQPTTPARVSFTLTNSLTDARFTLRRRSYRPNEAITIDPNTVPELVEVSAPGHKTIRYWLTLDRPTKLTAVLPEGTGISDATEQETLVALGEAPATGSAASSSTTTASAPPPSQPAPAIAAPQPPRVVSRPDRVATVVKPSGSASGGSGVGETHPGSPTTEPAGHTNKPPDPATPTTPTTSTGPTAPPTAPTTPTTPTTPTEPTTPTGPVAPAKPTIDVAAVRMTVRAHLGEIQQCYDRGRMDQPDLAGRVTVQLSIAPGGNAAVTLTSSTLHAPIVEACIVKVVRGLHYPEPSGGTVDVVYPFSFK